MQLRFSDIVSLDADTFFIPLSLCFLSAIKVIGVCEYFDSMVKSDNCDLKWPLEDVKFRQDLRLSLLQIQMISAHHSWLLFIGWSTLFCPLIGKSRKSTSLSGWCLCLQTASVNLVAIKISHMMKFNNPLFFPFNSLFLLFLELLEPNCCADLSTQLRHIILSPGLNARSHLNILKKAKNCRQGSSFSGLSLSCLRPLSRKASMQASDWPMVSTFMLLIGHWLNNHQTLVSTAGPQVRDGLSEEWERERRGPNMQISWPRAWAQHTCPLPATCLW